MPIIASDSGGSKFPLAPEGPQAAVCCDVVDLGLVENEWKGKKKMSPMVRVRWISAECDATGKPYEVAKRYTNNLGERARLRKDLESWRGRPFTPDELKGFDLEKLIGVPCFLQVAHNKGYANVTAIMRLPKGMTAPTIPADYVRWAEREHHTEPPEGGDAGFPSDEDIPF